MKMNEEMKNCLLGLRMDITALESQRKEYGADIDLFMKQPHTLGTCECIMHENWYQTCELHEDHDSDCMMYNNLGNELYYAEAALEDMLGSIWAEHDHVEAPDEVKFAEDMDYEEDEYDRYISICLPIYDHSFCQEY